VELKEASKSSIPLHSKILLREVGDTRIIKIFI
jgi:hypothetical protein